MQKDKQTDNLAKERLMFWTALIHFGASMIKLLSGVITYGRSIFYLQFSVSKKRQVVFRS